MEWAASLTRQLLAYAGKGALVRTPVSVSVIAEKTIQLLKSSAPRMVEVQRDLAPNLPPIIMDPMQLEQLFINLILNGIEAFGEKQHGLVTVSTGRLDGFLRLAVSDSGSGMDQATQKRMFEPFFTTKFVGRGLGLAAVGGMVRSLHGQISVESALGCGTRIQILLPLTNSPDARDPLAVPAARAAVAGGNACSQQAT